VDRKRVFMPHNDAINLKKEGIYE